LKEMSMDDMVDRVVLSGEVEGLLDEAVLRRLVHCCGGMPGDIFGRQGKSHLLKRLEGYNQAARRSPWVVLVDLDTDADCAPPFRTTCLPQAERLMCFRVAVRAVEAWLLADAKRLAGFLGVPVSRMPRNPEAVEDPKGVVVDLARQSRQRAIKEDMVPRRGSGRRVGPAYAARLTKFVQDTDAGWRPDTAAEQSYSLSRCLVCIRRVVEEAKR